MATKKKVKPIPDDKLEAIADCVRGTTANVYNVAESVLGYRPGEEVFDQLREKQEIFRCEECDEWMGLDCRSDDFGTSDFCASCANEFDDRHEEGDDDQDEG